MNYMSAVISPILSSSKVFLLDLINSEVMMVRILWDNSSSLLLGIIPGYNY